VTGATGAAREEVGAAEIERLRVRVAVLEASIEGLRREAALEKRRSRERLRAVREEYSERVQRLSAIESSRAYRICTAYYGLFGLPLIGKPLQLVRGALLRVTNLVGIRT
jgi:hypothetical protein